MKNNLFSIIYICISVLITSNYATAKNQNKKYNICAITINSDNEKILFQKKLGLMDNKGNPKKSKYFNFIELANQSGGLKKNEWFDNACKQLTESKTSCDVVIISGHFGGTFFGSSQLDLSLEDLEKHSCNNSCKGLLQDPTEVFLFGCNTLAGKNKDRRSPAEYRRVLIDDGFTTEQAERIASARYGEIGRSFRARMKMVFSANSKDATHLYGFDSIAPSGKNIEGALKNYFWKKFKNKPINYYNHLQQEKIKRLNVFLSAAKKRTTGEKKTLKSKLKTNSTYKKSMRGIHERQCYGNLLDLDAKEREIKEASCTFYKNDIADLVKLKKTYELLANGNFVSFIPLIENYLSSLNKDKLSKQELATFNKIKELNSAKKTLLKIINNNKIHIPQIRISIAKLMNQLEWLSEQEVNTKINSIIRDDLISLPTSAVKVDILCSLYKNSIKNGTVDDFPSFSVNELPRKLILTPPYNYALTCLNHKDPIAITKLLLKPSQTSDNFHIAHQLMQSPSNTDKEAVLSFYKDLIKKGFLNGKKECNYIDCPTADVYIQEITDKLLSINAPIENHNEFLKINTDILVYTEDNQQWASPDAIEVVNYFSRKNFNKVNYLKKPKILNKVTEYFIIMNDPNLNHLKAIKDDNERLNLIVSDIVKNTKDNRFNPHKLSNYTNKQKIIPILYKPLMTHLINNTNDVALFVSTFEKHNLLTPEGEFRDYYIKSLTKIKQKTTSPKVKTIVEKALKTVISNE